MNCPVPNAIVPVAGLGTRLLPATKAQPKEMLPVGRKPVIQHVVEELARSGVRNVLLVTGRGKTAIENHFDPDPALIESLARAGKSDLLRETDLKQPGLNILYTRQREPKGLGDAILQGAAFAGYQPFIVALGDSIIGLQGDSMACRRMAEVYVERHADVVVGVEEVPESRVSRYGVVDPGGTGDTFPIRSIIEKPSVARAPSRLAVAGRYVFSPRIFETIRSLQPNEQGEIQITDAIRQLAENRGKVLGVRFRKDEKRYDIGNVRSYFETFIDFALTDPEHGARIQEHMSTSTNKASVGAADVDDDVIMEASIHKGGSLRVPTGFWTRGIRRVDIGVESETQTLTITPATEGRVLQWTASETAGPLVAVRGAISRMGLSLKDCVGRYPISRGPGDALVVTLAGGPTKALFRPGESATRVHD